MNLPTAFNGRRLRRRAWTVPFKLAFAPIFLIAAYLLAPIALQAPLSLITHLQHIPEFLLNRIGVWPLAVALFLAVCGWAAGLRYAGSASRHLAESLGVQELSPEDSLSQRVHQIAAALHLPPPKVAVMPNTVNAYAIGSSVKDAAVVIGLPLVHELSQDELDAIIGHELGHIVSGDMAGMQMAAGFQTMIDQLIGQGAVGLAQASRRQSSVAAPFILLAGRILQFTAFLASELAVKRLSRRREYVADAFGALASSPQAMASALQRLHQIAPDEPPVGKAHQYLMFWNDGGSLWATHPTLERRIAALQRGKHLRRLVSKACGERRTATLAAAKATAEITIGLAIIAGEQLAPLGARAVDAFDSHRRLMMSAGVAFGMATGMAVF